MPNITLYLNDEQYGKWIKLGFDDRIELKEELVCLLNNRLKLTAKQSLNLKSETELLNKSIPSPQNSQKTSSGLIKPPPNLILNAEDEDSGEIDFIIKEDDEKWMNN